MTRTAKVCGGELNGKVIKVQSTGMEDIFGKIIWKSEDGRTWELETTRHLGRTSYYAHERIR